MKTTIILSTDAVMLDADGYRQSEGIMVTDLGDVILIGNAPCLRENLEIKPDRIISKTAGWEVIL